MHKTVRGLLSQAFVCALALFLQSGTQASAAEVPSWSVGDLKVVRIVDHAGGLPTSLLRGADSEMLAQLVPDGICPNTIAALVVVAPQGPVLVDTGFGDLEPGAFFANLQAAGFRPADIRTIVLTHLHPDHLGGLLAGSRKAFPNAVVLVDETELAFWSNRANLEKAPESMRGCFELTQRLQTVYGDAVRTFRDGDRVLPWLQALRVPGHTAGHTMFLLEHKGEKRYLWGDIMHCMAVQARHPEVTVVFDSDEAEARETRKRVLHMVADTDIPVFGLHLPAPGAWTFRMLPDGGCSFAPVEPDSPKQPGEPAGK